MGFIICKMYLKRKINLYKLALLALEDGSIYKGISIGYCGNTLGEVIFNTSITGYQEIITDPSYIKQIVNFTNPHVGNTGINNEDIEYKKICVSGLILNCMPNVIISNDRSNCSLIEYLKTQKIVCIANIDTRSLTIHLRDKGIQQGAIITVKNINNKNIKIAKKLARKKIKFKTIQLNYRTKKYNYKIYKFHIVVYDFGTKYNIIRILKQLGCCITIISYKTSFQEIISMKPTGVLLSNGPGNPEDYKDSLNTIKQLCTNKIPLFGICLGHQLLALASGAKTKKMNFGHHGSNHPILDIKTGKIFITSQNHCFVVDEYSLPKTIKITHRSIFDGTLQGLERTDCPALSFQGHPEANPGPQDANLLFYRFIKKLNS
ncbi:glutamine-hydrolyzing carbamoyl-phosphate synthase small subunit [Candidatus Portiera aleyrodidarum]|uniref:glutamine-hydrolyzing carbamoyl-phosphate synthase small subunit n=1 Tax=Candidatus Portiera aleyrodidarum TaxID=91844 RepID=UPI000C78C9B9|nr:glutamine-hydrolyzing carbamoyl-phosphate synthase small subunit [Candidatus Portiera aleyrodidarum]AUI73063.1 carbamoyl phosphate synthase small subunit [Candidatus Portiera aleyrodidarum]